MYYAYKYRLTPSDAHREELDRHRDICRQLYNHTLYRLNEYQDERGVEHSFSRSTRCRSGTLRITACGDCAPCGHRYGICKARRGNRKSYPQGANGVSRERVG